MGSKVSPLVPQAVSSAGHLLRAPRLQLPYWDYRPLAVSNVAAGGVSRECHLQMRGVCGRPRTPPRAFQLQGRKGIGVTWSRTDNWLTLPPPRPPRHHCFPLLSLHCCSWYRLALKICGKFNRSHGAWNPYAPIIFPLHQLLYQRIMLVPPPPASLILPACLAPRL